MLGLFRLVKDLGRYGHFRLGLVCGLQVLGACFGAIEPIVVRQYQGLRILFQDQRPGVLGLSMRAGKPQPLKPENPWWNPSWSCYRAVRGSLQSGP